MSVDEYFTEIEFSLLNRVSTAAPFEEKNPQNKPNTQHALYVQVNNYRRAKA